MSQPLMRVSVDEFEIRKESYSSHPWRIFHAPTQQFVSIPQSVVDGDGMYIPFRGQVCFQRKRDALAWVASDLPALVDAFNATVPA